MKRPTQAALAAISALPDGASFEEMCRRLRVLDAIREGVEDIDAGRAFSHEGAMAEEMAHGGRKAPACS